MNSHAYLVLGIATGLYVGEILSDCTLCPENTIVFQQIPEIGLSEYGLAEYVLARYSLCFVLRGALKTGPTDPAPRRKDRWNLSPSPPPPPPRDLSCRPLLLLPPRDLLIPRRPAARLLAVSSPNSGPP